MLNSFQEGVLVICCVNMIAVLGMSVLTGFTRLFSFGNAGFMSIGAYAAAICSVQFKLPFVLDPDRRGNCGYRILYSRQSDDPAARRLFLDQLSRLWRVCPGII